MDFKEIPVVLCPDRVIDGLADDPKEGQVVAIEGNRIRAVCDREELPSEYRRRAAFLELPGMTIAPGFVDAHVHLVWSPSTPLEDLVTKSLSATDQEQIQTATDNCRRAVEAGVTTLRDCGGPNDVVFTVRDAVAAGHFVGPRILASGHVLTRTGGHCYYFGEEVDDATGLAAAVRRQVERGADFIKIMVTAGGAEGVTGGPLRSAAYTLPEVQAAVDEASKLGKHVAAHCHSAVGAEIAALAGVQTVEHCSMLGADDAERRRVAGVMKRRRVYASLTNASMYRYLEGLKGSMTVDQLRSHGWCRSDLVSNWRILKQAGVPLLAGTDAGGPCTTFADILLSIQLLVRELGLTPMEALKAATSLPSQAIGLGDESGALVAGRAADLVAVDGNPLEDISSIEHIVYTIKGGRLMAKDGRAVCDDASGAPLCSLS